MRMENKYEKEEQKKMFIICAADFIFDRHAVPVLLDGAQFVYE